MFELAISIVVWLKKCWDNASVFQDVLFGRLALFCQTFFLLYETQCFYIFNHKNNMGLCELEELQGYMMLIISVLCYDNEFCYCIVSTKLLSARMG